MCVICYINIGSVPTDVSYQSPSTYVSEFLHNTPTKVFTRPLVVPDLEDSLYSVLKQRAVYNGPIKKFVELRNKMVSLVMLA